MKESKVKKFVKNHTRELVIAGVGMAACVAGVYFGRKSTIENSKVYDDLMKIGRDIDIAKGDATNYVPMLKYDIARAFPDGLDVIDPDGNTLKVTGALLFGNIVKE